MADDILKRIKTKMGATNPQSAEQPKAKQTPGYNPPAVVANKDTPLSTRIYNAMTQSLQPQQRFGPESGIQELEVILDDMNSCQLQLDKIVKLDRSSLYRGIVSFEDGISGLLGMKPTYVTIEQLFVRQAQNVVDMNYVLGAVRTLYAPCVGLLEGELDNLLQLNEQEYIGDNAEIKSKIAQHVVQFEQANQRLSGLKKTDPEYHTMRKQKVEARRKIRELSQRDIVREVRTDYHDHELDNIDLQENLFGVMLDQAEVMIELTNLYGKTLERNMLLWSGAGNLYKAVSLVGLGVHSLSKFSRALTERFTYAMTEMTEMVSTHPGAEALQESNTNLRRLIVDVHNSRRRNYIPDRPDELMLPESRQILVEPVAETGSADSEKKYEK